MVAKEILFDSHARARLGAGVDALANVVKLTLGPRGGCVALDVGREVPVVSKDGVAVAHEIALTNRFANMGAALVKGAAMETASAVGDGTTTSTVLAQAIYVEGAKLVAAGVDPMSLKRGIDAAVAVVVRELKTASRSIHSEDEILQVATTSANGDRTSARIVASAMATGGVHALVLVENGSSNETTLTVTDGFTVERGYASPHFVTDTASLTASFSDAYVFVHNERITLSESLLPLLEKIAQAGRPLLLVADIDGDALSLLVLNKLRGVVQVCAIKPPGFGDERAEQLDDIAIAVGCQGLGTLGRTLASVTLEELGRADRVNVGQKQTDILGGKGSKSQIRSRVKYLQDELEGNPMERQSQAIRSRLSRLAGGASVIKVGGFTESEIIEKRQRIDDALSASRAAMTEGVGPGGGVALLRTLAALDELSVSGDERFGVAVLARAIQEPLRQIAENGGVEGSVVVQRVREGEGAFGYNAMTQVYEDLVAAGITEPTMVVRLALQNAASVATMLLTTAVAIAEDQRPMLESNFATRSPAAYDGRAG